MKNTITNKSAFFAQYWGQKILRFDKGNVVYSVNAEDMKDVQELDYLEIKPISEISKQDAIEVARICDFATFPEEYIAVNCGNYISINHKYNDYQDEFGCLRIYFDFQVFSIDEEGKTVEYDSERARQTVDFLRSKGYLLPFRDISTDELISFGWAKTK